MVAKQGAVQGAEGALAAKAGMVAALVWEAEEMVAAKLVKEAAATEALP